MQLGLTLLNFLGFQLPLSLILLTLLRLILQLVLTLLHFLGFQI